MASRKQSHLKVEVHPLFLWGSYKTNNQVRSKAEKEHKSETTLPRGVPHRRFVPMRVLAVNEPSRYLEAEQKKTITTRVRTSIGEYFRAVFRRVPGYPSKRRVHRHPEPCWMELVWLPPLRSTEGSIAQRVKTNRQNKFVTMVSILREETLWIRTLAPASSGGRGLYVE